MWIEGQDVQRNWLGGEIRVDQVLYEFGEPIVFRSKVGFNDFLFSKRDESEDSDYFIVVETNDQIVAALNSGNISLRGALFQNEGWLVEMQAPNVVAFQYIPEESLERFLPAPHVGLYSSFGVVPDTLEQAEALIAFRFLGPEIRRGHVPLTVLKEKVDQFSNFVRKTLTPPSLNNGRDYRFFDVQMAEPRFTSLVLAAKKAEFDLERIQNSYRIRPIDSEELSDETERRANDFWHILENAREEIVRDGRLSENFVLNSKEFLENLTGLIPSTDGSLENVEITFNDGQSVKTVLLNRQIGDAIVEAQERMNREQRTINGVITEVNGDSRTFLIKDLIGRQTTCELPWAVFERLDQAEQIRRGKQVSITGDFTARARRDRIWSDGNIVFLN